MRAGLTSGTMQAVVMPVTTAANLHTRGLGVKLANVMTNGLLYVISSDPAVKGLDDLRGRRVTVPFANDTPELVFDAVLARHGLTDQVTVDRSGSPIEAIQMLLAGRIETALVPEPAAAAAIFKGKASGQERLPVIRHAGTMGCADRAWPDHATGGASLQRRLSQ